MTRNNLSQRYGATSKMRRKHHFITWALLLVVALPVLASCGSMGAGKTEGAGPARDVGRVDASDPAPGSVKIVGGVEYIYGRNIRWMKAPNEPEYVWVRKDQYSPGLFESLTRSSTERDKEFQELKKRIEKLESEMKKGDDQP